MKQAKIVKLESKKDEKTGRMMMVPVEGSEFLLDVDLVLIAAGFLAICIWVSHWSFVRSVKEETSQEKWMSH